MSHVIISAILSAVLRLKAVEPGVVVIQGVETGKYLAMSNAGHLHSSVSILDTEIYPFATRHVFPQHLNVNTHTHTHTQQ